MRSGHEGWVRTVAVDPTNEWSLAQLLCLLQFGNFSRISVMLDEDGREGPEQCLFALIFFFDFLCSTCSCSRFASSGNDRLIKIWDLASGTSVPQAIEAEQVHLKD